MSHSSVGERAADLDLPALVAGEHGAEPIRDLVLNPFSRGVNALLAECLPEAGEPAYTLLRTRHQPDRSVTACYELTLPAAGQRHACVTWSRQPQASLPAPGGGPDEGSIEPFTALAATSADGLARLQVSPGDPSMPQLRRLSDPAHMGDLLSRLLGRSVPPPRALDMRIIRYRPGQRHVLVVRSGPGRPAVIVKTDSEDSGRTAVPVARAMAPQVAARCAGAHVVESFGYDEGSHAAVWGHAPGAPLSHQLTQSATKAIQLVRHTGQAVRAWHESGLHAGPWLRQQVADRAPYDIASELEATRRAGESIAVLLPDVWSTYDGVLTEVAKTLDSVAEERATLIHGDLNGDNVMVVGGHLHLLDMDRVAWSDPALDLGRFLADLSWWCRDEARASALGSAFRSGYGPGDSRLWVRADLLAEMYRLYFAAQRCALQDPRWEEDVTRHVDDAAEAVGRRWGR